VPHVQGGGGDSTVLWIHEVDGEELTTFAANLKWIKHRAI
jgi:hypothetical protein